MKHSQALPIDKEMMNRCIALSSDSAQQGEYPYAAIISRNGHFVCESLNRVARDHDVTRHAEVVALSEAQKILGRTSLDDCTIYVNAEPCAFCCYAIRESRIGKVVFGLRSPLMGGLSRWNILADRKLSSAIPEVFAPPPEIIAGCLEDKAEVAISRLHPVAWKFISMRYLFVSSTGAEVLTRAHTAHWRSWLPEWLMAPLRRTFFDRIGRR